MGSEHRSAVNPDPVLTPLMREFGVGGPYVYDAIVPVRPVPSQKVRYATWDFGPQISEDQSTLMAPDGPANEASSPTITWATALTQRYGLKDKITDSAMNESTNPGALVRNKVMKINQALRLQLERATKAGFDAASNATTLTGALQWNNASATIEKSIDAARELFLLQCGFTPNVIICPPSCWDVMKRDSTLRSAMQYTNPNILNGDGGINGEDFLDLRWVVPGAIRNTANPGATVSVSRVWSDDKVYLAYIDMSAATDDEAVTAALLMSQDLFQGQTFAARSWRPAEDDEEWTWYQVWTWYKLIFESACIHRLDDVLA